MVRYHSCSTFLDATRSALLIGHNLDGDIPVPGLVFANPRGQLKENIAWQDIVFGRLPATPRLRWRARFGSLTYNAFGKDFPDGGLNEAGFYIGEMTLFGTRYPPAGQRPRFYHNHWMQYLLDTCQTVDEALANLQQTAIEGHCQWHFFLADRHGACAVVEFIHGETRILSAPERLILGNDPYTSDLERLRQSPGAQRIAQVAEALCHQDRPANLSPVDYAFALLDQLDCGNNKWGIVYDLTTMRMYFRTHCAKTVRWVDFSAFDLSESDGVRMRDIHQPGEGEVSAEFSPFDAQRNRAAIADMWAGMDSGWSGNLLKPLMVSRMSRYPLRLR